MPVEEIYDRSGQSRRLGYLPPRSDCRLMRASRTNIQTYRAQNVPGEPVVFNKSEILQILGQRAVDFVSGFPLSLINNQGQYGACVGASCCGASQRQRYIRGQSPPQLSWAWVYDQINGGADNGAVITDALQTMTNSGAPPLDQYAKPTFRAGKPVAGPFYKEDVAVTLSTALECATALVMGGLPQVPVMVDQAFERFTGDGIAWNGGASRSQYGNHSIYLAGLKVIANEPYFILVNSWDKTWGPFSNGTCLASFAAIDNCADLDDGWVHFSTPADPEQIPSPV